MYGISWIEAGIKTLLNQIWINEGTSFLLKDL